MNYVDKMGLLKIDFLGFSNPYSNAEMLRHDRKTAWGSSRSAEYSTDDNKTFTYLSQGHTCWSVPTGRFGYDPVYQRDEAEISG
jgi:DNA polymerase III alpha subunit